MGVVPQLELQDTLRAPKAKDELTVSTICKEMGVCSHSVELLGDGHTTTPGSQVYMCAGTCFHAPKFHISVGV